MMQHIDFLEDNNTIKPYRKKNISYSNVIYTFDIESTSLFDFGDHVGMFDPSIPNNSYLKADLTPVRGYDQIPKLVCPYIGMFSVEDKVYYFRDMRDLEKVLTKIHNKDMTKIIYVHNLAFEMAFYRWLWIKYPITDIVARKSRQPIQFYIPYFNVIFRCSLRLTELSLARAAEQYTDIHKKSGDLDYTQPRHPNTYLTDTELGYCEYDCLTLYKVIDHFRYEYGSVKRIPLTQTGEVRRAYAAIVPKDHVYKMQRLVPSVQEFKMLYDAFQGGLTHSNILHTNKVLPCPIISEDECSAYPSVMAYEKYPCERFTFINPAHIKHYDPKDYAFIFDVTFKNINSKFYNHYIPRHKCRILNNEVIDNGRVAAAGELQITVTDLDLDLIMRAYTYDSIRYNKVMVARKDYLPKYFIEFMLELYCNKTKYKNVAGMDDIYMKSKQLLNSLFGCCCTNIVRSTVTYEGGKWHEGALTDKSIRTKLAEQRQSKSLLFAYSTGVYVTAFNRARLFEKILTFKGLDEDVVYYDTDSLKIMHGEKYTELFKLADLEVDRRIKLMCDTLGIDYELTRPKDPKGIAHPLGHWETDAIYDGGFITLGAKRYAYKKKGQIDITISGVGKGNEIDGYARDALKGDLANFNEKLVFDYEHAHKLEHSYIEGQKPFIFKDLNGVPYKCEWPDGVNLKPTTYSMSLDEKYRALIDAYIEKTYEDVNVIER